MNLRSRFQNACKALFGPGAPTTAPADVQDSEPGGPEATLARLRLDLTEARAEIQRLRDEYARRERQAADDVEAARGESVVKIARRICPLLSQLATMRALAAEGREVRRDDVLTLAGKLESALADAGIASIGRVGDEAPFSSRLHQRMSGGDVRDGDVVFVRFVGYQCGTSVVTKAMVSRKED